MKSVMLDSVSDGEMPPFRWRSFHNRVLVDGGAFGLMVFGGPRWALHLYAGRWLVGIERTCEED